MNAVKRCAHYFADLHQRETGEVISEKRLMLLLYLGQHLSYDRNRKPLYDSPIRRGFLFPVLPEVRKMHRNHEFDTDSWIVPEDGDSASIVRAVHRAGQKMSLPGLLWTANVWPYWYNPKTNAKRIGVALPRSK